MKTICFGALWIHTTLKQVGRTKIPILVLEPSGFTLLSNIHVIQLHHLSVLEPSGFTLLSNKLVYTYNLYLFWSPLDSHYSQTSSVNISISFCFGALWIHTTLKRLCMCLSLPGSFGALWIHTTLKHCFNFL